MISIIIPAHNERHNLSILLPMLNLEASRVPVEVIVVLSCNSSDGSEDLEVDSSVKFIKCKKKGRAVQMNTGASISSGNILAFLHADVKPPPSFLGDIENALSENYEAGFFSYRFDKKKLLVEY
ncbi:glycosyltransferase [Zobellia nedashkovskayae]